MPDENTIRHPPCDKLVSVSERMIRIEVVTEGALKQTGRLLDLLEEIQERNTKLEERLLNVEIGAARVTGGLALLAAVGGIILWFLEKMGSKIT